MDQNVNLNLALVCVETGQVPESNLGSLDFGFRTAVLSQGWGALSRHYVTAAVYLCVLPVRLESETGFQATF